MSLFDKFKQQNAAPIDAKVPKEIAELKQQLQNKPNDPEILRQLGTACETHGLNRDAIQHFSTLGRIYQKSPQTALAIAYFRKAERLADLTERATIWKDIEKTYHITGQFEEAYKAARHVIELYLEIDQKEAARGFVVNLPALGEKDAIYRKELREMIGEKDEAWAQGARGTWVEENSPKPTQLIATLPGYTASKVPVTLPTEKAIFAPMRVLVVDDDQSVCKILTAMLRSIGCQSSTASNGTEALQTVASWKPHLIISDLLMPQMDGSQFFAKLQENPETQNIPFVCLSSRGQEDEKLAAFSKGVEDYWVKPFVISELAARTKKLLQRQWQKNASSANASYTDQAELSGRLGTIPMPHLLRMLEYMSKTGLLTLINDESIGSISFQEGWITDAQYESINGETALFSLISWQAGRFIFESQEIVGPRVITDSLDQVFEKLAAYYQSQT